jgi:hypothetical protein
MNFLISIFFGAGVAAFAYSKLGRRVGYGNQQSVWIIVGVTFVITAIVFFTLLSLLGINAGNSGGDI